MIQLTLTTLKTVDGFTIALTDHNSLVVLAPTGERGFPELARGIRRRDASPVKFLGRLTKVPKPVEDELVLLLKKQSDVRRKISIDARAAGVDDADVDSETPFDR